MRKIILTQGIQGSGKTTYAKQWVEKDPVNRVRWNNDDCRKMCGPYWIPERENFISEIREKFILNAMKMGKDIVVDDMNLNQKTIAYYNDLVDYFNLNNTKTKEEAYDLVYKTFFIPLEECIKRDSLRPNPIGEKIIKETFNRYKYYMRDLNNAEILYNRIELDKSLPNCIIVDLDNTLAYAFKRPWFGVEAASQMVLDKVNEQLKTILNSFNSNIEIIIMSGRAVGDEAKASAIFAGCKDSSDEVFTSVVKALADVTKNSSLFNETGAASDESEVATESLVTKAIKARIKTN